LGAVSDLKPDVVGIDEVQFLDRSFSYPDIFHLLYDKKIDVICAGLDLDFQGNPFPISKDLMPYATKVWKLKAVCSQCGSYKACRTQRMDGNIPITSGDTIQVGGSESYEARCLDCWITRA
jgi:thymidine kinase